MKEMEKLCYMRLTLDSSSFTIIYTKIAIGGGNYYVKNAKGDSCDRTFRCAVADGAWRFRPRFWLVFKCPEKRGSVTGIITIRGKIWKKTRFR